MISESYIIYPSKKGFEIIKEDISLRIRDHELAKNDLLRAKIR